MQFSKKLIAVVLVSFLLANQIYGAGVSSLGGGSKGESMNYRTGNLMLRETDVYLPGKGMTLDISRTYNSQGYNIFELIMLDLDHKQHKIRGDFEPNYDVNFDNLGNICRVNKVSVKIDDSLGGLAIGLGGLGNALIGDLAGLIKSFIKLLFWFLSKDAK